LAIKNYHEASHSAAIFEPINSFLLAPNIKSFFNYAVQVCVRFTMSYEPCSFPLQRFCTTSVSQAVKQFDSRTALFRWSKTTSAVGRGSSVSAWL
jgi:hypothetical protein